jgi:DNA-binding winged helix-turn-helix (wHTH) protein
VYALSLDKRWVNELCDSLSARCQLGDNTNIWGIPTVGVSTYIRKLQTRLNESEDSKIKFAYIDTQQLADITTQDFYHLLNLELQKLANSTDITPPEKEKDINIASIYIEEIVKDDNCLVIAIDTLDNLKPLDKSFFSTFKALRDKFKGSLCFIFASTRPVYEDDYYKNLSWFTDFASHKEIISKPFSEEQKDTIHTKVRKLYDNKISDATIDRFIDMSGGFFGLFKSLLRIYDQPRKDRPQDLSEYIKHPYLSTRLKIIEETFSTEELRVLKSLANKGRVEEDKLTHYLTKSGILTEENLLKIPILVEYFNNITIEEETIQEPSPTTQPKDASNKSTPKSKNGLEINLETGEIYLEGERQKDCFSTNEINVYKTFIQKKGGLVSRDDIAKALWPEDTTENYSDWAIDKTISRMRKKLDDSKRPYKYITTIKGKGFKLLD